VQFGAVDQEAAAVGILGQVGDALALAVDHQRVEAAVAAVDPTGDGAARIQSEGVVVVGGAGQGLDIVEAEADEAVGGHARVGRADGPLYVIRRLEGEAIEPLAAVEAEAERGLVAEAQPVQRDHVAARAAGDRDARDLREVAETQHRAAASVNDLDPLHLGGGFSLAFDLFVQLHQQVGVAIVLIIRAEIERQNVAVQQHALLERVEHELPRRPFERCEAPFVFPFQSALHATGEGNPR